MSEKRMFLKTIIDSEAFLKMPLSTQALFFHLSERADNDGFIENHNKICSMIGVSDDDLKLLINNRYLVAYNGGMLLITAQDKPTKPARHKYGEYKNVLLSDDDMLKLRTEFPDDFEVRIERLSSYMASTGKSYKNHLATIRNWARKDTDRKSDTKPKAYDFSGYEI